MNKLIIFLLVIVAIVSGCVGSNARTSDSSSSSGTSQDSNGVKVVDITVFHTSYEPKTITVNKGDNVKLRIKTAPGTNDHNHGVTIDEYGINAANTDPLNPTEVDFTANNAGEFTIYCKTCWDGRYGKSHPAISAQLIVK